MAYHRKALREPSVVQRVSDILNLFSEDRPQIELDDAMEVLGLSQATVYRYLREMHKAGLLSRTAGKFMPGPKMIELEFIITRYDPLIVAAKESMKALSQQAGCDVLLGRRYDIRIVNVASVITNGASELNFPPGRTVPPFRGSQARAVLAAMDRRSRRRLYDLGDADPDRDKIATDWKAFNATLNRNRKDGFYISRGELDTNITGIAVPVFDHDDIVIGSLVVVISDNNPPPLSHEAIIQATKAAAIRISQQLRANELASSAGTNPPR